MLDLLLTIISSLSVLIIILRKFVTVKQKQIIDNEEMKWPTKWCSLVIPDQSLQNTVMFDMIRIP